MKHKTYNKGDIRRGFTLIEVIISLAIFLFFIGAILGIFISGISIQRKALANQELLDQTSYVMEYMNRALRMAQKDISGSCITAKSNYEISGNGIRFLNYNNKCQEFVLAAHSGYNMIHKDESSNSSNSGLGSPVALTSSKLNVISFNINSFGWGQNDDIQPRVTIFLEVEKRGGKPEERPKIEIQTTISQRNLDIQK